MITDRWEIVFHEVRIHPIIPTMFSGYAEEPIRPFSPFSSGRRQMVGRKRRGTYLSTLRRFAPLPFLPFHSIFWDRKWRSGGKERKGNGSSGPKGGEEGHFVKYCLRQHRRRRFCPRVQLRGKHKICILLSPTPIRNLHCSISIFLALTEHLT